jgi:hypothetical protein
VSARPRKIDVYLAAGNRLRDAVNAYRAAKEEANGEEPTPTPTKKRRSHPLPPADGPTPIPGYPLAPSQPKEIPDYGSMARVAATRAAMAERRGKRAPLTPIGPSELRKKGRGRP